MKEINYTYKFRLYPSEQQEILLSKHFGSIRFVYNYFLNERKNAYLSYGEYRNNYANCKKLTFIKKTIEYDWLNEVNAQSLQSTLNNLELAYNKFFQKKAKFPRFKSRKNKQSFHIPQKVKVEDSKLYIFKFKEGIKINLHREIEGKIKNATVTKTKTGKYFVSICVERNYDQLPKAENQVGIDVGIKEFLVCSNGDRLPNPKIKQKYLKKIKYLQRQISKKKLGGTKRKKEIQKLALIYEKIGNIKSDFLHKITSKLIHENQVICIEDLNVAGMVKNHKLAEAIQNLSIGETFRQLTYKSNWNDRNLVAVNRWFPSSKTHFECGFINHNLTLSDRNWTCINCKGEVDRDFNASRNILRQGLNELKIGSGIESIKKQLESLAIVKAMKVEAHEL